MVGGETRGEVDPSGHRVTNSGQAGRAAIVSTIKVRSHLRKARCGECHHLKLRASGRYQPNQISLASTHSRLDKRLRATSLCAEREFLRAAIRSSASATRVAGTMTVRGLRTHPCTPLETQPRRASQTKQGISCASSISTMAANSASASGEATPTKSGISKPPAGVVESPRQLLQSTLQRSR